MAMVTDYDCWRESEEAVSIDRIIGYLQSNAATAMSVIRDSIDELSARNRDCLCATALQYAIITDPAAIPQATKERLAPIIGKYVT